MEKRRNIFYAIFIAIIVVSGIIYFFSIDKNKIENIITEDELKEQIRNNEDDREKTKDIFVQVCGAISQEGVYKVSQGTRVFEIVELAGGLRLDASTNTVNQAREAKDGELIYFPTNNEVLDGNYSISLASDLNSKLININTASKEELMTLPGIGEAKANSIIKYRDLNNGFNNTEEIMQISGIKESVFQNIKDLITI